MGLLVLSPVLMFIACWVKLSSSGPVFYRGVRAGINGEPFLIFKFRTMVSNAEQLGAQVTAMDDARITSCGRFLRRYKFDEFPQLINVLKGDMSIVGPRPEALEYVQLYRGEEHLILTVRPGITDLASIELIQLGEFLGSQSDESSFNERVQKALSIKNALRVQYVKEHTFGGDILIIVKTFKKLIRSL